MAIATIQTKAVPSQAINIVLLGQPCVINLTEIGGRQYFSLSINSTVICQNVLIVNRSGIVRAKYTGLKGEFAAIDTVGDEPPVYTGWGTRWILVFNTDV